MRLRSGKQVRSKKKKMNYHPYNIKKDQTENKKSEIEKKYQSLTISLTKILKCSVCSQISLDTMQWYKCQHPICLPCVIKRLKKPFCDDEKNFDPKKIFCQASLILPPTQRIQGMNVSDCTIMYGKCLPAMRFTCPVCKLNPVHLFHENTSPPFQSILFPSLKIPDLSFLLTQCEWCDVKFDDQTSSQRINHILYDCKKKHLPCPFVSGCKVKWYPMSEIQQKRLPYYNDNEDNFLIPEEWADEDSSIYRYLTCLLKNHVMEGKCGELTCSDCELKMDLLTFTQHNVEDCEVKMKIEQLQQIWENFRASFTKGKFAEYYQEKKLLLCETIDRLVNDSPIL